MEIRYEIKGVREMEKVLEDLGPRVSSRIGDQALRAAAKPIIAHAKNLVPRRTEALARSITAQIERRRKDDNERVILIGFRPPVSRIAHLVEFGTRHSRARPFLRPALDDNRGEALAAMGKVLGRGIDREARKLAKPIR